jgi:hypothetical protein
MKKIAITITTLAVLSFTLLDTKTVLCKSWKVKSFSMIKDGIAKLKADLAKPGLSADDKTKINASLEYLNSMDAEMKKSIFTYKSDGTYSVEGFQPETGKWSLSKDQKMIFSINSKNTTIDTIDIIKITDLELKYSQRSPSGPMVFDFTAMPVKK